MQSIHFLFFNNKANKSIKNEEILYEQKLKITGFYKDKLCNKTFLDLLVNSIFSNIKNAITSVFIFIKPFIIKYREYLKANLLTSFIFIKIASIGLKINTKLYSLNQICSAYSFKYCETKNIYLIHKI